jgi:prepilin-type N-terminal cleavage/methylation domain-containing protein
MKKGFTLIELLVVIAIIGLLTAIVTSNFSQSKGRARDAKRVSDIGNLQLALALYFDRCNFYPGQLTTTWTAPSGTSCNSNNVTLGNYIAQIPSFPTTGISGQTAYDYAVDTDRLDYYLHTKLEYASDVIKDGLSAVPSWYSGSVTCSSVPATREYCLGPK